MTTICKGLDVGQAFSDNTSNLVADGILLNNNGFWSDNEDFLTSGKIKNAQTLEDESKWMGNC